MAVLRRKHATRSLAAFTLVELLAVIAIIATLASLILPAINRAREEARRTQCLNHLKEVAAATTAYESTNRCFPPGYLGPIPYGNAATPFNFQFIGLHAYLLPHLGMQNLSDRIDRNLGLQDVQVKWWGSNTSTERIARENVPTFLCPSAANQPPTFGAIVILNTFATSPTSSDKPSLEPKIVSTGAEQAERLGITNYLGVAGAWGKTGSQTWDRFAGVFGNRTRTTAIRDGKSMTLMIGEATNESGRYTYSWMGAGCLPVGPRQELIDKKISNPNSALLFSSYHSGGVVQFALADGSAKPISMAMDQTVYEAMAGINDGVPFDLSLLDN